MTLFRGCIDIHSGVVKQIVGGTLAADDSVDALAVATNYTATQPADHFAQLYREHGVAGCHVIKLGLLAANDHAAAAAVAAWPGHLQVGGGITAENAQGWIDQGALHVIVTLWLFPNGEFALERLRQLSSAVGREHVVVDLSCRRVGDGWMVAINKWQTVTSVRLLAELLAELAPFCDEFLVHAADVEGLCQGIDTELVQALGVWSEGVGRPVTYAGGAKSVEDLELVERLSQGRVDLTFGSALDIFGGKLVTFSEVVAWNKTRQERRTGA